MIDFDTEDLKVIERGMSIMKGVLPEADPDWKGAGRIQKMIMNRPSEPESPRCRLSSPISLPKSVACPR